MTPWVHTFALLSHPSLGHERAQGADAGGLDFAGGKVASQEILTRSWLNEPCPNSFRASSRQPGANHHPNLVESVPRPLVLVESWREDARTHAGNQG